MAVHEFGIMPSAPGTERYDAYEPQRYGCVEVSDDLLETVLPQLDGLECFWHTTLCPGRNLAYCGITLIPPQSLPTFLRVLCASGKSGFAPLICLLEQAERQQCYLIHFGL